MRAGRWAMTGVLLGAGLLASCANDDDQGLIDQVTSVTSGPQVDSEPAATGSTWLDLLQFVPDTSDTRTLVVMGDVAGAAEVRGVEMPTEDEAAYPVAGYYSELSGISGDIRAELPTTGWMPELQGDDEIQAELGFSYGQVDAYLMTGELPDSLDVLLGRFDAAEIDETLADVPYWSEVQEEVEHGDVTYHRWLDDLESDFAHVSPARPLGHGGRMWVTDDHVTMARSDAMVEASIDAVAGDDSLADDEAFRSLADVLDQPGLYGAFLTDEVLDGTDPEVALGMGADPADLEAYEEELAAGEHVLLGSVEAYGSAWGLQDGEPVAVLAIVAEDEDGAAANEDLFTERFEAEASPVTGAPYTDSLEIVRSEVAGRVTTFWFEGDQPTLLYLALMRRDPVVVVDG